MLNTRLLNRGALLILLPLCVFSLNELLTQTFSLSVSPWLPVILSTLCVSQWLGSLNRKAFLPCLLASTLLVYYCLRQFSSDLGAETMNMLEQIGQVYVRYLLGEAPSSGAASLSHTSPMLLFLFLLVCYFSLALHAPKGRITLVLIVFLPLSVGCIAVNGDPPITTVFSMALFLTLLFLSGPSYSEDSGRGLIFWAFALPCALVLLLCLYLADPVGYSFDEADVERSRRFDRLSIQLSSLVRRPAVDPPRETAVPYHSDSSLPNFGAENWSIRKNSLDMSYGRPYTDTDEVVLLVTAETEECLYLRRCSYGDYTGRGWQLAEDDAPLSSLSLSGEAAASHTAERTALISVQGRSDVLLLPYFSDTESEHDAYLLSALEKDYRVSYYSCGGEIYSLQLSGDAADRELLYRGYAHSRYTQLPDTTAFSAQKILEDAGIGYDDTDLIWEIAAYVQQSGSYDIRTLPYQSADYAIFFLTQSHRGYCLHFATAATVLYRAAGIPARLTDGFLVSTKAGETVEVTVADEHAWVEIYLDGLGWVPVEVTGSAGFDEARDARIPSPYSPQLSGWTAAPSTASPSPSPSTAPSPLPDPAPVPSPSPVPETGAPGLPVPTPLPPEAEAPEEGDSVLPRVLFIVLLPLLIAALLFWIRQLLLLYRKGAIRHRDGKKAAIAIWREAKALCQTEEEIPDAIRSCAEQAAFGRAAPEQRALREARQVLRRLEDERWREAKGRQRLRLSARGRLYR